MTDTPLFDATLSDHLLRTRREAEARIAEVEREAAARVAAAELRASQAEHRQAVWAEPEEAPVERDAPPVPSMEELMRPMPGINRFLDSLLGVQHP